MLYPISVYTENHDCKAYLNLLTCPVFSGAPDATVPHYRKLNTGVFFPCNITITFVE